MIANNVAIQSISGPKVKTNICANQKLSQDTQNIRYPFISQILQSSFLFFSVTKEISVSFILQNFFKMQSKLHT